MTDKLITEQKVRLILDKTYIDGVKSGKGGLGYSERAFDQFMELLADERAKVLSEVESWLVDEDSFEISKACVDNGNQFSADLFKRIEAKNDLRDELRTKLNQLKRGK